MDGAKRVAMVETKTIDGGSAVGSPVDLYRFQLDNHLGSACLELDGGANVISYEEYAPYGSTSYRASPSATEVSARRYRYTGKERDEETGLYYYGARYYAAWLGRWTSADPLGLQAGLNLYLCCRAGPVTYVDPDGLDVTPQAAAPLTASEGLTLIGEAPLLGIGSIGEAKVEAWKAERARVATKQRTVDQQAAIQQRADLDVAAEQTSQPSGAFGVFVGIANSFAASNARAHADQRAESADVWLSINKDVAKHEQAAASRLNTGATALETSQNEDQALGLKIGGILGVTAAVTGTVVAVRAATKHGVPEAGATPESGGLASHLGGDGVQESGSSAITRAKGSFELEGESRLDEDERAVGNAFKAAGFDVVGRATASDKGVHGVRTSDLSVSGVGAVDVFTPKKQNATSIGRMIESKGTQASTVAVRGVEKDRLMHQTTVRFWGKPSSSAQAISTIIFERSGELFWFQRPPKR